MDVVKREYSPKKLEYNLQYKVKNLKRIPLDVQMEYYEKVLKPAAAAAGVPVNTFIKQAIKEKIEKQ